MKLFNTLSGEKEVFKPVHENKLTMYVCGPTVYNYIHIGNARPVVFFDVVKRYFTYLGYQVTYVSNITDVDDKIIEESQKLKIDEKVLTQTFTDAFIKDSIALGSELPDLMPKATNYIADMIFYINDLIEKGYAYHSGDSVYFRVTRIKDYGQLSKQVLENLNVGARIELDSQKETPFDFTLWKQTSEGIAFDSPWGKGRPGWHTECAVMNHTIFNHKIDIHGGGSDLKFPHHENEMAQSCAHDNHELANIWMHVGRLNFGDQKMSKSVGNIILVKDLLESYEYQSYRLLLLSHHYRQPINYTDELMKQFDNEWQRIKRAMKQAFLEISVNKHNQVDLNLEALEQFKSAMDDDFNVANALSVIYEQLKNMNRSKDVKEIAIGYHTIALMLRILGIELDLMPLSKEQIEQYLAWQQARAEKRYQEADKLRIQLVEMGVL
ncbi:cysteinyl-tRNA synthetase [Acholeplasma morum]|uniref:cysteine--tRNA ligase n=1 Tax=Paracholeplasma morum TaxID=264637 RepID=UPI00195909F8|nr:cysteine--tRNA ligase [Paracholeplasma morum]MBM7452895.1 cysteinyl-tRNA synthetase [Paracholeplasma morum]